MLLWMCLDALWLLFFLNLERLSTLDGFSFQDGFFVSFWFFSYHCLCWLRTGPDMGGKVGEMVFFNESSFWYLLAFCSVRAEMDKNLIFFSLKDSNQFWFGVYPNAPCKACSCDLFFLGTWLLVRIICYVNMRKLGDYMQREHCSGGICLGVMLLGKNRFSWWLIGIALRCVG